MSVGCGEEDVSDVVSLVESTLEGWEELDLFGLIWVKEQTQQMQRIRFVWADLGERTNTIDAKKQILKSLCGGVKKNTFVSELR